MAKSAQSASRTQARTARDNRALLIGVVGAVVVVLAIVAVIIFVQIAIPKPIAVVAAEYTDVPQTTTADGAPILGSPDAKVMILEFADFSCPHCLDYHATMEQVIDELVRPGKVRLLLRPMTYVGGLYSTAAAEAALCAGKQGRFWDMDAALFNLQRTQGLQAFQDDMLKITADRLSIDGAQMIGCMTGTDIQNTLSTSAQVFDKLGATDTPTLMYSTDGGTTFKPFIADAQGKPAGVPSFDQITQALSPYIS